MLISSWVLLFWRPFRTLLYCFLCGGLSLLGRLSLFGGGFGSLLGSFGLGFGSLLGSLGLFGGGFLSLLLGRLFGGLLLDDLLGFLNLGEFVRSLDGNEGLLCNSRLQSLIEEGA